MVIEICKHLCTLCPLYRPDQGNIVGREYINFYKFLLPYGISLSDSTIELMGHFFRGPLAFEELAFEELCRLSQVKGYPYPRESDCITQDYMSEIQAT
jgi:hypothetical protein